MVDTKPISMHMHSLAAVIGSSLFFASGFLAHLSPALLYAPSSTNIDYAYFAALGGSALFALLICYRALHKIFFVSPRIILINVSLLSVLTLLEALATTAPDNTMILIILGILDGFCRPLVFIAWGARFAWETNRMPYIVLLSYILSILLFFAISAWQPRLLATTATVLFPLLSGFVWLLDIRNRKHLAPELDYKWLKQGNNSFGEMVAGISNLRMLPWLTLIILAFTTFLGDLISSVMARLTYGISSQIAVFGFLFALLLCMSYLLFIIAIRPRGTLNGIIHFLLPVIIAGMVAILVFGNEGLILSTAILRAAGIFFEIIIILLIAFATQQEGLSPLLSFGAGTVMICSIKFFGHMAGLPFYLIFGADQEPINIAIGLSIIIIFMLSLVAFRPSNRKDSMVKESVEAGHTAILPQNSDIEWEAALDDKIQRFSQAYRLSNRECEILSLLVRGRSTPKIAESMYVTSGTIKTHLTHIYNKTDSSGRQTLIDLFESFIRKT